MKLTSELMGSLRDPSLVLYICIQRQSHFGPFQPVGMICHIMNDNTLYFHQCLSVCLFVAALSKTFGYFSVIFSHLFTGI